MSGVLHGITAAMQPDPYYASVVALLRGEGSNGSTTIEDSSPLQSNWTAVGNAQVSTAQNKHGSASILFDGAGDAVQASAATTNFDFPGDFTIELWFRPTSTGGDRHIYDSRPAATQGQYITLYMPTAGGVALWSETAPRISGGSISANNWYHLALCRSGSSVRLFLGGTQVGSTYTRSGTFLCGASRPYVGLSYNNDTGFVGNVDDVRITKGQARYTSNFTPPGPL